ncbi:hypothetical protein TWF694_005344 [Orbilia ellipsospora]|uniref:Mid2 domain-containing protein n=1 Tax=Orbilia ellipsospora TaxID=2528407 RepID=A0AAV9WT59_9PEZI
MANNGGLEPVDPGFNINPTAFNSFVSGLTGSTSSQTPIPTDPQQPNVPPNTSIRSSTSGISTTSAITAPTLDTSITTNSLITSTTTSPVTSITTSPFDSITTTSPITSTTAPPSSGPKQNNTGVIAGAVCGGVALVVFGGLAAIWLITRDRRKRIREARFFSKEPPIPVPPDVHNQSISEGNDVFSGDARQGTRVFLGGYGGTQS